MLKISFPWLQNSSQGKTSSFICRVPGAVFLALLLTFRERPGSWRSAGKVATVGPGRPQPKARRDLGKRKETDSWASISRWHEKVWAQRFSDRFILLWEKDLRLVLLNNCADKWQLHSITFQWEHYSRNIGNGETFSCAFQIWDDIWNGKTSWCPVLQWKANEIQFQRGMRRSSWFLKSFLILKGARSWDVMERRPHDIHTDAAL